MSWRSTTEPDEINVILTSSEYFHSRHKIATAICKRLNVQNKSDRIFIFQGILYGTLDDIKIVDNP